jgi:hemoglobin
MSSGGEPACWAHLLEDQRPDITTRDDIHRFVLAFYRDVAMDDVLGPVFSAAHVDWSVHIPKLVDFWAWQLLGEPAYERNPLRAHEPVHARTLFGDVHYQRWLALFDVTLDGLFAGPTARAAKQRARRMASAMRRLLDGQSAGGDRPNEVVSMSGNRSRSACSAGPPMVSSGRCRFRPASFVADESWTPT